ncbi:MAG: hypothetical protein ACT4TC_13975 [Myxococcaceae bacterium]
MAKINNNLPPSPMWPWGGPRNVKERLVDPAQLDRKKAKKTGNPKNPALASAALLDWIAPAHSSDELRLPLPPHPEGHDADLEAYQDRQSLQTVSARADPQERSMVERALGRVNATPDRLERMKGLLAREAQMLSLVSAVNEEVNTIIRKMREEQSEEAY